VAQVSFHLQLKGLGTSSLYHATTLTRIAPVHIRVLRAVAPYGTLGCMETIKNVSRGA
jgi:hypothetical protein